MSVRSTGRNSRPSSDERAKKFGDLTGRIDFAAIGKQNPQTQMMILQQKEQELAQAQSDNQTEQARLQQQLNQGIEQGLSEEQLNEIKTEVDLALAAGQKLGKQFKSVQEAKLAAENVAREELSFRNRTTPTLRG